ncbi:tRNA(Phe) wybutosine-synthesizing methylase Tyw3 [Bradyrhizobium sp. USDA 4353]
MAFGSLPAKTRFGRECGFRVTVIRTEPGYRVIVNLNG